MIIPFPQKKYNAILCDPPWNYRDSGIRGGTKRHYRSMPLKDIVSLPVEEISDDNCFLFLWVTFPMLPEGLVVISEWGFVYKTVGFSWVKTNKRSGTLFFGTGRYTRANSEVCLLGVKGRPVVVSHSVSSMIMTNREEHSKKPAIVRDRIVELCGDVSRIELFARGAVPAGWDSWGREVGG